MRTTRISNIVNAILSNLTLPLYGELVIPWCKTSLGATQRAWSRALLLFN
ncbi:hypothetical protein [Trichormus azollae]|nr:hypothetical protein [Trichormus azollae]